MFRIKKWMDSQNFMEIRGLWRYRWWDWCGGVTIKCPNLLGISGVDWNSMTFTFCLMNTYWYLSQMLILFLRDPKYIFPYFFLIFFFPIPNAGVTCAAPSQCSAFSEHCWWAVENAMSTTPSCFRWTIESIQRKNTSTFSLLPQNRQLTHPSALRRNQDSQIQDCVKGDDKVYMTSNYFPLVLLWTSFATVTTSTSQSHASSWSSSSAPATTSTPTRSSTAASSSGICSSRGTWTSRLATLACSTHWQPQEEKTICGTQNHIASRRCSTTRMDTASRWIHCAWVLSCTHSLQVSFSAYCLIFPFNVAAQAHPWQWIWIPHRLQTTTTRQRPRRHAWAHRRANAGSD